MSADCWTVHAAEAPLEVTFPAAVTFDQVRWLLSTTVPLRSLSFADRDPAACVALQQQVWSPVAATFPCQSPKHSSASL